MSTNLLPQYRDKIEKSVTPADYTVCSLLDFGKMVCAYIHSAEYATQSSGNYVVTTYYDGDKKNLDKTVTCCLNIGTKGQYHE